MTDHIPSEREALLIEAANAVRERGASYGRPSDHFGRTIGAINAVFSRKLREPFEAADWGIIMILDKCAREQHESKRDNMIDTAGYSACVAEIRSEGSRA